MFTSRCISARKTKRVEKFLAMRNDVHLHFTPTSSSWLNQVEVWLAKIECDVITRGIFTSGPDLKRKLMRDIRQYNKQPKPVRWNYFDSNQLLRASGSYSKASTGGGIRMGPRCLADGRNQRIIP